MVNQEIVSTSIFAAQSKVWGQLKQISLSDKLGSAYLFSGPPGCGKEGIAIQFAKLLNCESGEGNICENCPSCIKITNLQHEKLNLIFPLPTPKKQGNTGLDSIDNKDLDTVNEAIKKKSQDLF